MLTCNVMFPYRAFITLKGISRINIFVPFFKILVNEILTIKWNKHKIKTKQNTENLY